MKNKAEEIITESKINLWIVTTGGKGKYNMAYDGHQIILLRKSKRAFLIYDEWCGGNVEGYCYRSFYSEISYDRGVESVLASANGQYKQDEYLEGKLFANAPVWLKKAHTSAEPRVAGEDVELTKVIEEDVIG